MDDPFDEIRRQQERLNELLRPSRQIQEEILRSYAPIQQLSESLRAVTDGLVAKGVPVELLRSMKGIGKSELADFACMGALTSAQRELTSLTEAIREQSRWIEEASGLSVVRDHWVLSDPKALAAIEMLTASRRTLLQEDRWLGPRPLPLVATDVLHAGRSEWALAFEGTPSDHACLRHFAAATADVIEGVAAVESDALVTVAPGDAARGAATVARVLSAEVAPTSETSTLQFDDGDRASAFSDLLVVFDVLEIASTRTARPLFGGGWVWITRAGLVIVDPRRLAEERFGAAVRCLHDAFVDGLQKADPALAARVPGFFRTTVKGLRDTLAAHAPEAAVQHSRIAANLQEREKWLREFIGRVPVSEEEWLQALGALLRLAANAAIEFRSTLG